MTAKLVVDPTFPETKKRFSSVSMICGGFSRMKTSKELKTAAAAAEVAPMMRQRRLRRPASCAVLHAAAAAAADTKAIAAAAVDCSYLTAA